MNRPSPFSGIILTGGGSRRMKRDKAFVLLNGRPLVSYPAATLRDAGATEIIAVGGAAEELAALGLRPVADGMPGSGPLGAIVTGLETSNEEVAVVLACDQPGMTVAAVADMLRRLHAAGADAAVPVVEGRRLPVSAAYRTRAAAALRAAFERGERAAHRGLAGLQVEEFVPVDEQPFVDVDDPDELRRYASTDSNSHVESPHVEGEALEIPEIEVEQLEPLVDEGVIVLDVREPHEWAEGYIDGAKLVSMADVPECIDDLPDDAPIYLICARGNRSRRVGEYLLKQGLDVYNVSGGMVAWTEAGKPTRQDPPAG